MKESTKIAIIIALYILIGSSIIALFLMKMQSFTINDDMEIYSLGQLDQPGYVGIELYYDKEPVDIHLIAPDERLVYKQFADIYSVDEDAKKITFLTDTDKVGLWKVEFNKKLNKDITYKFVKKPSPTMHVSEISLYEDGHDTYVSFTPICEEKTELATDTDAIRYRNMTDEEILNKCQYSMLAYKDGYSIPLSNEIVDINQPCMVKLELPDNMYDGGTYRLRVCCMMLDNIDNYDFKEVKIQTENIMANESSEESNSEQDTSDETE